MRLFLSGIAVRLTRLAGRRTPTGAAIGLLLLAVAGGLALTTGRPAGEADPAGTAPPLGIPAALIPAGGSVPPAPVSAAADGGLATLPVTWDGWVRFGRPTALGDRSPATLRLAAVPPVPGSLGWIAGIGATAAPDELSQTAAAVTAIADSLWRRPAREGPEERVVRVEPGDTLTRLLVRAGVLRTDAQAAIAAVEEVFDPRDLQIGQEVTLSFHHHGRAADFLGFTLMPDVETVASVARTDAGAYRAATEANALVTRRIAAAGVIDSSLAGDAAEAGIPYSVLHRLVRAYSYDVDFQRDVQPGDGFRLLFEQDHHESGAFARHGEVLYAALRLSDEWTPIIRFETPDGAVDYYHPDGLSVRKALLRTPVDGLRMSSGFGMRRHPILGYSRMHRGVDFAGPTGTPILAAGDGVVEVIGQNRGYGNYIRLRHNNSLQTAYAHMSRFARGLARGSRVAQGDVIGYIGSTGLSTGPHLHYEVLVDGSQVNPLTIDMPTGRQLAGAELAAFQALTTALEAELTAQIAQQAQIAEIPGASTVN